LCRAKRRAANLEYRSGFICKDGVGPEKEWSEAFLPSLHFKRQTRITRLYTLRLSMLLILVGVLMRLLVLLLLLYVLLLLFVFLGQLLRLLLVPLLDLLHPRVVGLLVLQLAVILLLLLFKFLVILLLLRVQLFLLLLVFSVAVRIPCVGCRWPRVRRQFVRMDGMVHLPVGTSLLRWPVIVPAFFGRHGPVPRK
jgi:hypothetical protein